MGFSIGIDNKSRKATKMYVGVNGVARKVKKAYVGDADGVARCFYEGVSLVPISSIAVGSSVYMNVNGVRTEFLIVHQGLPSSSYDATCNGTWLIMKDVYSLSHKWEISTNNYGSSALHTTLNNDILPKFDANVQNIIKQVNLPTIGSGTNTAALTLSTKLFIPSSTELGLSASDIVSTGTTIGSKLSYFDSGTGSTAKEKRIAYLDGVAKAWWTRSPRANTALLAVMITSNGSYASSDVSTASAGLRPTMIIPSNTIVNSSSKDIVA